MKTKDTLNNDVFVMRQAWIIIEHHFAKVCDDTDARNYGLTRTSYLKNAIEKYQETSGEDGSAALSLWNLFSPLYDNRGENTNDVIWTDIRDELSRIVYNA